MKITIVMGFFLPVPAIAGGATEKIWHRLGEMMASAGHDVTIISRRWPGLPDREVVGRLRHVRLPGWNHSRRLAFNLFLDLLWGLKVALSLPPGDVVVCNTVSLPIYLRRLRPGAGRVAVVLGRMPKGQTRAYGGVDCLLATSTAVADRAKRENPRVAGKIFRFPNPMDWTLQRSAARQDAQAGPATIGYVGRIHPEKGLEQLLDAAIRLAARSDLPPWRVVLIGPATVAQGGGGEAYRDGLLAKYRPLLGERVAILPPVFDPVELAQQYGSFSVFCYPSLAAKGEGLSIAPIEAMAAGAVPVVSNLDCYRDLIVPGENGFCFDHNGARAVGELADILASLLRDEPGRRAVAARAQATARRYDYVETASALLAEFGRIAAA